MDKNTKIVLATRTNNRDFEDCKEKLNKQFKNCNIIEKIYIVCDKAKDIFFIDKIKCEVLPNEKPIEPTTFNQVIDKLKDEEKKNNERYHLLTFSKEVLLQDKNIKEMVKEIEKKGDKLIVVGYQLKDNILSDREFKLYSNGNNSNNVGIAYKIPWNTCALWNKKFVYGTGNNELRFDEICNEDKNQLGKLKVKVNGELLSTDYKGMEDGLAIAELVTKNSRLKYKLFNKNLSWIIEGDEERIKKQKKKMARKNIVLSTFIQIKGYSIDKLRNACA